MRFKGAIAIAQEYAGCFGAAIRADDIESAIAVHIPQGNRVWGSTRGEGGLSLKSAIAIAQEHTCAVGTRIRSDDIEFAIAVHIAQGHGVWCSACGEG